MYFKDDEFRSFHICAMICRPVLQEIDLRIADIAKFQDVLNSLVTW